MEPSKASQHESTSTSLETDDYTVSELGSATFRIEKVVYNWTILDLTNWSKHVQGFVSPKFSHPGSTDCYMKLTINSEGTCCLYFYFLWSKKNPEVTAEVTIRVTSRKGEKYFIKSERIYLSKESEETEPLRFMMEQKKVFHQYLKDSVDNFTIQAEVSIPKLVMEPCRNVSLYKELQSVIDSLETLLLSGELTDLVVCAGGRELRAHRALLAARSPVFAAMFRNDSSEAQSGRVEIKDVDPDVLAEMLHYIYTGRAPGVRHMAGQLLVAADKYDLQKLKEMCEVELANSLTVDTAAHTAVVALGHSCDFLLPAAVRFIKENLAKVLGSEGWAAAVTKDPQRVTEISRLIADKNTK